MLSDPICLLIGGSMALLIGWSALRAMRTTLAVQHASSRLAKEVGVGKIVDCEPVGEPAAGEVLVRLTVQLPFPAGGSTDVQVVRSVAPTAVVQLIPGAVVIVEFDPLDMASVELRLDMTPPQMRYGGAGESGAETESESESESETETESESESESETESEVDPPSQEE